MAVMNPRTALHLICYRMLSRAATSLSLQLPCRIRESGRSKILIAGLHLKSLASDLPRTHGLKALYCTQSCDQKEQSKEPFFYPGKGFAELGITPEKLLQPGDPDTYEVRIRDVMPVGYFVDMPNGREGYLPANDLGFSGGIERLRTIFQVGQPVVVRITFRGPSGRELLSIRKYDPERPPVEPPRIARSSGSRKHKFRHMRQNS